jgi:hypothetical protein
LPLVITKVKMYYTRMCNLNPSSKDIDIKTQEGLDLLKIKAKYYGHYAENLKVLELIEEIESLRSGVTGDSPSGDS